MGLPHASAKVNAVGVDALPELADDPADACGASTAILALEEMCRGVDSSRPG